MLVLIFMDQHALPSLECPPSTVWELLCHGLSHRHRRHYQLYHLSNFSHIYPPLLLLLALRIVERFCHSFLKRSCQVHPHVSGPICSGNSRSTAIPDMSYGSPIFSRCWYSHSHFPHGVGGSQRQWLVVPICHRHRMQQWCRSQYSSW